MLSKVCQQQLGEFSFLFKSKRGRENLSCVHGIKAVSLDQIEPTKFMSSSHLFPNLSMCQTHLESLLKHRLLGSPPLVYDPVGLSWSLIICISDKSPGDANAAEPYLENLCLNRYASLRKGQKPPS